MKQSNFTRKLSRALAPLGLGFGVALPAAAAVPEGVTTAITGAGTDMTTVATAVIIALVAFWALKKIGTKMGWW